MSEVEREREREREREQDVSRWVVYGGSSFKKVVILCLQMSTHSPARTQIFWLYVSMDDALRMTVGNAPN